MSQEIPRHLQSTADLIGKAYPNGLPETELLPLLVFLSEHLSEENLAILAESWFPEKGYRLNDVLLAKMLKIDVAHIFERLSEVGLEDWLKEE